MTSRDTACNAMARQTAKVWGVVGFDGSPPEVVVSVPARVVGEPRIWSRDLALVGLVTGFAAPTAMYGWLISPAFCIAAAPAGAAVGAAIGRVMPWLLDKVRGRVPLVVLVAGLGPALGAFWGGATGFLAGLAAGLYDTLVGSGPQMFDPLWMVGMMFGAIAGAAQLGWLWFPYTFQMVRGGRRWPVLLTAMLIAPVTAYAFYLPNFFTTFR